MGEIYGLYCVCDECQESGKDIRYVGQTTVGSDKRFKSHINASRIGKREELKRLPVYRWISKHGEDNIRSKVLEITKDTEILDTLERKWIGELGTYGTSRGLNATPGGVSSRGFKHSEESKNKMKDNFKSRERRMKSSKPGESHPLATFSEIEVGEVKRLLWSGVGATEIARDNCIPVHRVQQINTGKSWPHIPWPIGPRVRPPYRSSLSPEKQVEAVTMKRSGKSYREVSEYFGVSVSVIFRLDKNIIPKPRED